MNRFGKSISTVLVTLLIMGAGFYAYKIDDTKSPQESTQANAQEKTSKSQNAQSSQSNSWGGFFDKAQKSISDQVSTATSSKKPYLAIIMDDIAYPRQFEELQKLGLKITPSFFPVSYYSPQTAKLAAKSEFYMVHLPLEAMNIQSTKFEWMRVNMDIAKMQEIIAKIKRDFPKLKYINNHTGSKFSASFGDMQKLLYVMDLYGLDFVDSRTTANTQAPKIYEDSKRALLSRDVFLDNQQSSAYINYQINQAIETAKQKGYAIAICHPHSATFRALKEAKSTLLQEVNLVYVKDLPIAKSNRPRLQIALDDKTKAKINPKLFEGIPDSRYAKLDSTMFAESRHAKARPQVAPKDSNPSVIKQAGFSKTPAQISEVAQMAKYNKPNSIKSQAGVLSTPDSAPKPTKSAPKSHFVAAPKSTPSPQHNIKPTTPNANKQKQHTSQKSVCSGDELEAFVSGCANGGDMGESARQVQKSQNYTQNFLNVSMCKDAGGKWQNGKCQYPKGAHSFSSQSISMEGF